jgi:hypothetical protein
VTAPVARDQLAVASWITTVALAWSSGWPQLSQTVVGSGWMLMPVLSASADRGYSKPEPPQASRRPRSHDRASRSPAAWAGPAAAVHNKSPQWAFPTHGVVQMDARELRRRFGSGSNHVPRGRDAGRSARKRRPSPPRASGHHRPRAGIRPRHPANQPRPPTGSTDPASHHSHQYDYRHCSGKDGHRPRPDGDRNRNADDHRTRPHIDPRNN